MNCVFHIISSAPSRYEIKDSLILLTVFEAAQPALLYLVPACLGSSLLCATVRGELKALFEYSEEEEEEEEEGEQEKKDEKTKKDD